MFKIFFFELLNKKAQNSEHPWKILYVEFNSDEEGSKSNLKRSV